MKNDLKKCWFIGIASCSLLNKVRYTAPHSNARTSCSSGVTIVTRRAILPSDNTLLSPKFTCDSPVSSWYTVLVYSLTAFSIQIWCFRCCLRVLLSNYRILFLNKQSFCGWYMSSLFKCCMVAYIIQSRRGYQPDYQKYKKIDREGHVVFSSKIQSAQLANLFHTKFCTFHWRNM